jgi:hypothetical protein
MSTSEKSTTADVYAGDLGSLKIGDAPNSAIWYFSIEADAEAGTFAQIANVFNIANRAPRRVSLELRSAGILNAYIELTGIGAEVAYSIQRKLKQLTTVIHVDAGVRPSSDTL